MLTVEAAIRASCSIFLGQMAAMLDKAALELSKRNGHFAKIIGCRQLTDAFPSAAIDQDFRRPDGSQCPRVISMPNFFHIPRTLNVSDQTFSENELLAEPGIAIILAEPGAGKTSLLASVAARLNTRPVRASIFDGIENANNLVVDALDEVARIDTSGLLPLLRSVRRSGAERTVIASRSGEWEAAQTAFIRDLFEMEPIVAYLEPLDEHQQNELFQHEQPDLDFDAFRRGVRGFDLAPLLGNPQFLKLFAAAYAEGGGVFSTREAIFDDAIRFLAHEANEQIPQRGAPTRNQRIAWSDEVFSKLLLAGADGVSVAAELDGRTFPQLGDLSIGDADCTSILDTRLFKPANRAGCHEPVHRIVAEYGAARHLNSLIEDPATMFSAAQCLSVAAPNGVSRDELRGLLGWIAALGTRETQEAVIEIDPYAVLSNGDPSRLTASSKRALLDGLVRLSEEDPFFRRSDVWRSFSASGFFTAETIDTVRGILGEPDDGGHLKGLLFELLEGSPAINGLTNQLTTHILDEQEPDHIRERALYCLIDHPAHAWEPILEQLSRESGQCPSKLASLIIESVGPGQIDEEIVAQLLERGAALYGQNDRRRIESRYHLRRMVKTFSTPLIVWLLDRFTIGLTCDCDARSSILCHCRDGVSKIAGLLLDRYFEEEAGPYNPAQVWRWLEGLNFHSFKGPSDSLAVRKLQSDDDLRFELQKILLSERRTEEAVRDAFFDYLHGHHGHSGLTLTLVDVERLVDWAFQNENILLWGRLIPNRPSVYTPSTWQPDPLRAAMRAQSREKVEFLARWSEIEKLRRDAEIEQREPRYRFLSRQRRRERRIEEANARSLEEDRELIQQGFHYGWLRYMARIYLIEPEKIDEVFGGEIDVPSALRASLANLQAAIPTLQKLAHHVGNETARVFHAGCLAEFRCVGHLDNVSNEILIAVRTDIGGYQSISDEEKRALTSQIDRKILPNLPAAEGLLRQLSEPVLAAGGMPRFMYWLSNDEQFAPLQSSLALEWLQHFPEMDETARDRLFDIAAIHGDLTALTQLIEERCAMLLEGIGPHRWEAQRMFWFLRHAFFIQAPDARIWAWVTRLPSAIFAFENLRENRRSSEEESGWPSLTAEKIALILDAFVDEWPIVELPNSSGTGSPREERAYRYLTEIIWTIGRDEPTNAIAVIDRLRADGRFVSFDRTLRSIRASSARARTLEDYLPPSPIDVVRMLNVAGPATVEHLRAILLEKLGALQREIRGGDLDIRAMFYNGEIRVGENVATERTVALLRPRLQPLGLSDALEHQMAQENRCDITVATMIAGHRRLLTIEAKGQWNRALFTAAEAQLYEKYSIHPDAAEQGIYLVYWFGGTESVAGRRNEAISTAEQLAAQITEAIPEDLRGRLDVFVLDLSMS